MKYFRHYFLLARRINQEFLFNQIISDSIRNRKTWGIQPISGRTKYFYKRRFPESFEASGRGSRETQPAPDGGGLPEMYKEICIFGSPLMPVFLLSAGWVNLKWFL